MSNLKTVTASKWPHQLVTPAELMQALRHRTRMRIMRSPICSKIVLQIVGSWAYLLANVLNRSRVHNFDNFNAELRRIEEQTSALGTAADARQPNRQSSARAPLLTLSNHISCIDDPVLWASLLPLTYYSTRTEAVRWTAAAVEICFSKPWHSTFFSLGKTFPIIRGIGVEQPAMDFASALLRCNQWLHLFPEGRVMRDAQGNRLSNRERGYIFKWGIAKLILDYFRSKELAHSTEEPNLSMRILPFYHLGLDDILPIGWPYVPRAGKQITIYMRPTTIEMNSQVLSEILDKSPPQCVSSSSAQIKTADDLKRIRVTNYLEEELERLEEPTLRLHRETR